MNDDVWPLPVSLFWLAVVLAVGLFCYFFPTLVARRRRHNNASAIFMLNLLLGWTAIGWALALVWAMTRPTVVQIARSGS